MKRRCVSKVTRRGDEISSRLADHPIVKPMTKYTDINLYIQRSWNIHCKLTGSIRYSRHDIYFQLYRRRRNRPFLHQLTPEAEWIKPEWVFEEDISRATVLFLKVFISWHHFKYRKYNFSPWNLVVFPANYLVCIYLLKRNI